MIFSKKRIVVLRQLGGIGDCLMMSCVYRGLKEKFPRSTIQLITGKTYQGGALFDIAERNPFIDEIHSIDPYDGTTKRTAEVWHKYYHSAPIIDDDPFITKADLFVDLNTACVDYEWVEQNTPEGIQKPRSLIWCEKAGVVPSTYAPVYQMTKGDLAFADYYHAKKEWKGKKLVGVGVSSCDPKRTIGLGRAERLCRLISELGYTPVVIDPTVQFPGYEYANGLRMSEVMAVVSKMHVVVTPDTGLLHMAGALKVPAVGIFGPTDAKMRMGDYIGSAIDGSKFMDCSPCWYKYPCLNSPNISDHHQCIKRVKEELVVSEIQRWMVWRERNLSKLRVL